MQFPPPKMACAAVLATIALGPMPSRADVPDSPSFCTTTLCFSITEPDYKIESVTTHYTPFDKSETSILHFFNGAELEFIVGQPAPRDSCAIKEGGQVLVEYPAWSQKSGCRVVTVRYRDRVSSEKVELREFLASTAPIIWALEEFPNGNWASGKANRLGPSVSLCGSKDIVACP
jgi:hypothetical protein